MNRFLNFSLLTLCICTSTAYSAGSFPDLEKCYRDDGQLETTKKDGKETTVYKGQAEVAADCNAKVAARAHTEKSADKLLELAGIVGRNSNWASAVAIFVIGAKSTKEGVAKICSHKDALYALEDALARPADNDEAKNAKQLMAACWPKNKTSIVGLLKADQNGYVIDNVCIFLQEKNAVAIEQKAICTKK